jgi:ribosome-associated translation inhibitor RaiA
MEIVYHAHHAEISDYMRLRTERGLQKVERRLGTASGATVRFEGDGTARRVEITVTAPRKGALVGAGQGKSFGPALTAALDGLLKQVGYVKGTRQAAVRREAQLRRVLEA